MLGEGVPASPQIALAVRTHLDVVVAPLRVGWEVQLDARLVRTFAGGIAALRHWRNRAHGLLLSELGG